MKEFKSAMSRAGPDVEHRNIQVNQYDKVLKENMEAVLPGLIKGILGIDAINTQELPDDIQHTKERKPDVLKKVTDSNGNVFVLHLEWQLADEKQMAFRMAEYCIMLLRRYDLPVRQYVIYLGERPPRMKNHIRSEYLQFQYQLIVLSAIDYRSFLSADSPEERLLAILGNFGNSDNLQVVVTIVKEIIASSGDDLSKERRLRQLAILSNLRKLLPQDEDFMESMTKWFKLERDPFYRVGQKEGLVQGEEKKTLEVIKSLLLNTNHSIPEIANLVNVPESFVLQVKESL
jgi:predicted transposase/invertase (TIGR01784 family)